STFWRHRRARPSRQSKKPRRNSGAGLLRACAWLLAARSAFGRTNLSGTFVGAVGGQRLPAHLLQLPVRHTMIVPVAPAWTAFAAASLAHAGKCRMVRLNEGRN